MLFLSCSTFIFFPPLLSAPSDRLCVWGRCFPSVLRFLLAEFFLSQYCVEYFFPSLCSLLLSRSPFIHSLLFLLVCCWCLDPLFLLLLAGSRGSSFLSPAAAQQRVSGSFSLLWSYLCFSLALRLSGWVSCSEFLLIVRRVEARTTDSTTYLLTYSAQQTARRT